MFCRVLRSLHISQYLASYHGTKHCAKVCPQSDQTGRERELQEKYGVVRSQLLCRSFIQNDVEVVTETDFSCLSNMSSNLLYSTLEPSLLAYLHISCLLQHSGTAQENEKFSSIFKKYEADPNKDNVNNYELQVKYRNRRRRSKN